MDGLHWWLAPLALVVVWWLAGRPGWPRGRPPRRDPGPTEAAPPRLRVDDSAPAAAAPVAPDAAAAAVRATEEALREAQESARRELAAREQQEREAAARVAAERQARQRAEAERLAAEAEARAQAEHVAEQARRRAAELTREAAAREAAARQAAEREAAAREAAAEAAAREAAAEAAAREAAAEAAAREAAARAAAAAPRARPPAVAPPRLAAQTLVMVADDSKVVRVKTSRLLAAHQFRVVLAEDGQQAWSLMSQEPPQVLITDVEMPGMDGLQLTRTVRADARTAALPVVMITSSDDRLRDEADAAGVTVLMGKPYTDQDLIGHVARLAGVTLVAR